MSEQHVLRDNIPLINRLNNQIISIDATLAAIDAGGRISTVTFVGQTGTDADPPDPMDIVGTADVSGMPYPPQMTEAVRAWLANKRVELRQELANLGVPMAVPTGASEELPRPPEGGGAAGGGDRRRRRG